MNIHALFLLTAALPALAQTSTERIVGALSDRSLAEQVAGVKTDDRISIYSLLAKTEPGNLHYQVLLAGAYVQKTRETTDYSYLNRAVALLESVLSADSSDYEARRLVTVTQLERHLFAEAAESSWRLIRIDGADSWNWGTLGDALIEMGQYDAAADAYQKMIELRPDLASYNRAAHYRFLSNDMPGAIEIIKRAIEAGSASRENVAWCLVDLGNLYFKSGRTSLAKQSFTDALRTFPNYHPAYAGIGKTLADMGDNRGAIENYRRAQDITPLPDYASALYDLYKKTGQNAEAARQMELLDTIDKLARAAGEKANRALVFAFADHDIKLDRALDLAEGELAFRNDVYSYDALAWALYKCRRYVEAREYMDKALKLKTPEPTFYSHAEAISKALARGPE